ncbi:MAG TPA: hypothetical protein VJ010_08620 [Actinomycetota bacterium]|nr:hypothetical protein [Actinomycetota bacterium]
MRDRGRSFLRSVATQAAKAVSDEANSLALEQRSSRRLPLDDLNRRAQDMEGLFREALQRRDDARALLRNEVDAIMALIDEDLAGLHEAETSRLLREAKEFLEAQQELRTAASTVDEHIRQSLRRAMDLWRANEERKVAGEFERRLGRVLAFTNDLVRDTVRLCAEVMQVELEAPSGSPALEAGSRFFYYFEKPPTTLEGILPDIRGYLPGGLAMCRLLKEVDRRVPELVDRQCGRLRWDFLERLQESLRAATRELDDLVASTIQSLRLGVDRVLERRRSSEEEALLAADAVASARAALDRIAAEVRDVLAAIEVPPGQEVTRAADSVRTAGDG